MGDKEHKGQVPIVEETKVTVIQEFEASFEPDEKSDYPPAGTNCIYSAILSRNEAVKDAKRLKTFLELRDKYVKKNVVFEDPLFPADDSSLFYSHKSTMKIEWKRPSVSASRKDQLHLKTALISVITTQLSTSHNCGVMLIWPHGCVCIALICHLLQSQTADSHTVGCPVCAGKHSGKPVLAAVSCFYDLLVCLMDTQTHNRRLFTAPCPRLQASANTLI